MAVSPSASTTKVVPPKQLSVEGVPSRSVGTHTILAQTELPNGDRLAYAIGGVWVQHEDAGTYSGEFQVDFTTDLVDVDDDRLRFGGLGEGWAGPRGPGEDQGGCDCCLVSHALGIGHNKPDLERVP